MTTQRRFATIPPPEPGGDPGKYHEELVQWFLENTFFRDFVYRNPDEKKKRGRGEVGDAVVLFGDVVLMVQVKTQVSPRDPVLWARKNIGKAAKQLHHTNHVLFDGVVRELENSLLGKIQFEPTVYKSRIGLIVVAQHGEPFTAEREVPRLADLTFPVHVLSLRDFTLLIDRFDTAGNFVTYLEFRHDFRERLDRRVHAEDLTLRGIADQFGEFLSRVRPGIAPEVLERSVRQFRLNATGAQKESPDWRFGLAIDDIIAHLHDRDMSLEWNSNLSRRQLSQITAQLVWLTRDRRIALGKRLVNCCDEARDGKRYSFPMFERSRGVAYVFLASGEPRADRMAFLRDLVDSAHVKFQARVVIGVATDPIGNGRSYDLVYREGAVSRESREFYEKNGSPFGRIVPLDTYFRQS